MRLISARIQGFGRLAETKINLDSKVIAVVGPNEAGKTTLLRALAQIDSNKALPVAERSRAADVSDDTHIVTLNYVLGDEDRAAVESLDVEEAPKSMSLSRKAKGGSVIVDIKPQPRKAIAPLQEALEGLQNALAADDLEEQIDPETTYADPHSDAPRDFRRELTTLVNGVQELVKDGTASSSHEDLLELTKSLVSGLIDDDEASGLQNALNTVKAWIEGVGPADAMINELWRRSPDFLLFDEASRILESTYTLNDQLLGAVPGALSNLVGTAGLDLSALWSSMQAGDVARRDTALARANSRLDQIFAEAWKQSRLSVRFSVDSGALRIAVWEDGDHITIFSERSAGLRMFIALTAFLRVHGTERQPVLLIDEAESHLHIDAQADLVNMFITQEAAVKVIYTTHSPACLPPDLGCGIRSVVPRADNLQVSDVKNSFWHGVAGYSPLMLAMGAAAAAFTPARRVVLAEGATEMILLPSLMRAATGETSLGYQVAPGLSEVPKDFYPTLDLEAAKVAYLLDGDDGGDALQKALATAGISEDLIVRLDAPGIENTLAADAYKEAMTALLAECNPGNLPNLPKLPSPDEASWASALHTWADEHNLKQPSKVAVANWLIENEKAIPSESGIELLKRAHSGLLRALGE